MRWTPLDTFSTTGTRKVKCICYQTNEKPDISDSVEPKYLHIPQFFVVSEIEEYQSYVTHRQGRILQY
jgi:hypothetical protein